MDVIVNHDDLDRIQECLHQMAMKSGSNAVMLIDRSGQLIGQSGLTLPDDSVTLAALAAANFGATAAIAKMIGDEDFTLLFHEGDCTNIHFQTFNGQFILTTIFDRATTLGLVRHHVDRGLGELGPMLERVTDRHIGKEADRTSHSRV